MTQIKEGLFKSRALTYVVTSSEDNELSKDKSPSPELISLVNEWAESYIKSTELPLKILELAEKEGLNKQQIREIVEDVLLKRGLSERRIREVLPPELKDQSKVHPKPAAAESAAKSKPKDPPPEENALETEIQFLKEQNEELKDALHKTEQFRPATQLQQEPIANPNPDEHYFKWLADRADGVSSFYYDRYGIDLFKNRILSQLKNSSVTTFKRLYFEV